MAMSDEQKKAASERMKAMHAAKKAQKEPVETEQKENVTLTQEQFDALMNRLSTLEESKTKVEATPEQSPTDQFGKPIGVIQKFSLDPAHYKDPRDKLFSIAELQRFAVKENYMLDWTVDQTIYETKYGTSMSEPKFQLVLYKKTFDDEGLPTDRRIVINRATFFEDPAASIKEATALGIPFVNSNSSEFLEQMRFLRYKAWLMDIFNPPKRNATPSFKRMEVIGGQAYEVEEYQKLA
jgi:hypothetical protein